MTCDRCDRPWQYESDDLAHHWCRPCFVERVDEAFPGERVTVIGIDIGQCQHGVSFAAPWCLACRLMSLS